MNKAEKQRRKELIKNTPEITAKEYFTDQEWADLMFASSSEVKRIMDKVAERHGLGLKQNLKKMDKLLTFEEFINEKEDWIDQYAAEIGADRKVDYDREALVDSLYEDYLNGKD